MLLNELKDLVFDAINESELPIKDMAACDRKYSMQKEFEDSSKVSIELIKSKQKTGDENG